MLRPAVIVRTVRTCVLSSALALLAPVASAQNDWYVNSSTGDDDLNDGMSAAAPFKTLDKALHNTDMRFNDGDTIHIQAAAYYNEANGETFPMWSPKKNLTLQGEPVGEELPVITAVMIDHILGYISYGDTTAGSGGTWGSPQGAAQFSDCLYAGEGWVIDSLRFENFGYRKKPSAGWSHNEVVGIAVVNLPSGKTVTISNCEFDDNFVGIRAEDTPSFANNASTRTVYVLDTLVARHGPKNGDPDPDSQDEGHQGILSNTTTTLTIDVQGCHLLENHDGIESGNAPMGGFNQGKMKLTDTTVELCENGVEFGEGALEILHCQFIRNGAWGASVGGVTAPTAAIGMRGTPGGTTAKPSILCRSTVFTDNQMAVSIKGANLSDVSSMNFGTTGNTGRNTFMTAIQVPWNSTFLSWATPDNISFCAMMNRISGLTVEAVGNTWRYETFGVTPQPNAPTGWNQGVASNGQFPSALTFGDASNPLNFDTGTQLPQPRPTTVGTVDVTSTNNAPWNLSTAANCFIHVK